MEVSVNKGDFMANTLVDRVLRTLLEAGEEPVSGETLAAQHGVTRAAVWKVVKSLRSEGFLIESVATRGYRLTEAPETLHPGQVQARISTTKMGRVMRHLKVVDSTNREAMRWADEGAPEGALVTADTQSVGRGRLGRSWHDSPGDALLASLVLRSAVELSQAPKITFVIALALAQALSRWVDEELIEIKWPNDLLLGGKKVAGILLESKTEGARVDHVIVGFGVNVRGSADTMPEEFRAASTTVAQNSDGDGPSVPAFLCEVLDRFEGLYDRFLADGFEALTAEWDRWFRMAGRHVEISYGGELAAGEVMGMDPGGALLLRSVDGEINRVYAGDVAFATTRSR